MATQENGTVRPVRAKTPLDDLFDAEPAETDNDPFAEVGPTETTDDVQTTDEPESDFAGHAGSKGDSEEPMRLQKESAAEGPVVAEPETGKQEQQDGFADVADHADGTAVEQTQRTSAIVEADPEDDSEAVRIGDDEGVPNAGNREGSPPVPAATTPALFGESADDAFATLAVADDLTPADNGTAFAETSRVGDATTPALFDESAGHDDFAALAVDREAEPAKYGKSPVEATKSDSTSPIRLEDHDTEDPFSEIGGQDEHDAPVVMETEEPEAAEEKDWSHLLDDFTPLEDDVGPDSVTDQQGQEADTGGMFGDDPGHSAFDEFTISSEPDFLQAASSSTTPPPDLSIENSFAPSDSRGDALGDMSMQSEGSNWLADTTTDDQPFEIQADTGPDTAEPPQSAVTDDGNSPLAFEVPYGWYDGDTFHYYTEAEREQVRLTMLGQSATSAPEQSSTTHADAYMPPPQPAYSENAARRTPNPEQQPADPYAPSPSSSNQPVTATGSYYGSQYTPMTGSTDPYAPTSATQTASSVMSPMQTLDPYAPAPAAWDPYPDPPSSSRGQAKPGQLGTGPRNAPSKKPAPPQRVASTAYDPPFLRTQKSFVRPVSAAPISSGSFGMTPSPAPVAPTPPPAPPSGPPRRSTTRQVMAPPPLPQQREPQPVQRNDYAPLNAYEASSAQMGAPKPPSRPPSTTASRPPQRAPSYNSFDPPLRAQPTSRPPSRAPQMSGPPQQSPATTLLSPPTDYTHTMPERPSSRSSDVSRGPSFEPPPPSGPPRRATPSFQPPPRPTSAASSVAPPPRPPSVSRSTRSPVADYGEVETLASPPAITSRDIPQLHSGQEELDEEGGGMDWDEPESENEAAYASRRAPDAYAAPPRQPTAVQSYNPSIDQLGTQAGPERPAGGSTTARPPPLQSRGSSSYDPYAASASRSPVKSPRESYHPYRRASNASPLKARKESYNPYDAPDHHNQAVPRPAASHDTQDAYNPYGPQHSSAPAESPSSLGLSSLQPSEPYQGRDDYAPPVQRSTGYSREQDNQYAPASAPIPAHDPYGPPTQQYTPADDSHLRVASPGYSTDYGTSPPGTNYFSGMNAGPADHTYTPQQVLEQKPLSEDPLGRSTLAARNKPLAIFGFGGVLVTCFPGMANVDNERLGHARAPSYGYASGRGQLWIRPVSETVSESALKSSETAFPGPLLHDPSSTKSAANDKKKKEAVLAYLNSRAEEIEKGLPYLKTSANATRREQEGKLALIRIVSAMVIGDGKLAGSQQVDEALRMALQNPSSPTSASSTFSPTSIAGSSTNGFATSIYGTSSQSHSSGASPAQLSQLSSMLATGDKRDAALYAANQGLWAHALLASSSVDQEFWREMVSRFTASELHADSGSAALKTSYAIFAGLGSSAVDDLIAAAHITDDPSADQWREVISSLLFNGKPTDLAYFDELAQRFASAGLINAGHVCSLLSPLSPFSDVTPGSLEKPIEITQPLQDEDAIIFAEVAEYARSLIVIPKGQELPVSGLPRLLPFKLARAWWAAELGEQDLAKRYCNAIESASKAGKNGPTLLSRSHLNSLEDLQERLTGEPSTKPANLFGGRKQTGKPGVNKLGSWIEGRLTKFIAGEEDTEGPIKATPPAKGKESSSAAPVGPFSHFSTISPGPSNPVTRRTSTADVRNGQLGVDVDSRRTSPSMGHKATTSSSSSSSLYGGEQYGNGAGYGGYQPYAPDEGADEVDEATPHALEPTEADDNVELLNPMAALSLGTQRPSAQNDYAPPAARQQMTEDDDDEDLGFGNTSLSRNRTPKPTEAAGGAASDAQAQNRQEDTARPAPAAAAGQAPAEQPRSGWLRGWFGKKEGDGPGPIRAKLGEESSMVYDNDLKRWVVKGAKPEAAAPAGPPPPPRAQTASPSKAGRDGPNQRAGSATPPPSQLSRSAGPGGAPPAGPPSGLSRSSTASLGFTETADGGIKRQKSSLAESMTPGDAGGSAGATPPPGAGPPRPPSGPPKPASASIDDLLSRPPSKRPASAARKGAKNRYVDVFQGQGNP